MSPSTEETKAPESSTVVIPTEAAPTTEKKPLSANQKKLQAQIKKFVSSRVRHAGRKKQKIRFNLYGDEAAAFLKFAREVGLKHNECAKQALFYAMQSAYLEAQELSKKALEQKLDQAETAKNARTENSGDTTSNSEQTQVVSDVDSNLVATEKDDASTNG